MSPWKNGGGGGGGGRPTLESVDHEAQKRKITSIFRAADSSFRPLFVSHVPDNGGSVFYGYVGTLPDQLLFLDVDRSDEKSGLRFRIKLESMSRYLDVSAAAERLLAIFPLKEDWQSGFPAGWFVGPRAVQEAADALAARREVVVDTQRKSHPA
jgi:hypothetical protein